MLVSEARLAANRLNSLKSRGPVSPGGRDRSRLNALTHSLTAKVVTPEGDVDLIRGRVEAFTAEMKPMTEAGAVLIMTMATLSVRMGKAAEHETAAVALEVRHAADDFDDERYDQVNALFERLADDPRTTLRKLKRMPEGVEKLVEAWDDLRADLAAGPWADSQLELAANLTGMKSRHANGSRLGALNRAIRGDFAGLAAVDGPGLGEAARKDWARAALLARIEAEVDALEAHHATLDFETLAIDRDEAGSRALFDGSKPATLARRYESEARRGFFKALKEFRQVEAEFAARSEASPAPPPPAPGGSKMGSFREISPPPAREPARPGPDAFPAGDFPVPDAQGRPLAYVPPVKTPG